jgi:hypothetical protein
LVSILPGGGQNEVDHAIRTVAATNRADAGCHSIDRGAVA